MCDSVLIGLCLTSPPADSSPPIFGFAQFGVAVTLLTVVYSSTDPLYKFRISVAPLPMRPITFASIAAIGFASLITELWFANSWLAPNWGISRSMIQGTLGFWFLAIVIAWTWFAFVRPPTFGRFNAKAFARALYRTILRGNDIELAAVGQELARSSQPLVQHSILPANLPKDAKPPLVTRIAYDVLRMIANRKLCRQIVASSPGTAILLMQDAAAAGNFSKPIGAFAGNITAEALINTDSVLFHEDEFSADLVGRMQPFSKAMYGSYALVEGTSDGLHSALDLHYELAGQLTAAQWEAYARIAMVTIQNYIETGAHKGHSYTIARAFHALREYPVRDLYTLNNDVNGHDREPYKKLYAAMSFASDLMDYLSRNDLEATSARPKEYGEGSLHDSIANFLFEIICKAATVKGPPDLAWSIHYNSVWSRIWTFRTRNKAIDAIRTKLSRLLYDEIKELAEFPNYKSSKVLGFLLNVLGFVRLGKGIVHDWYLKPLNNAVVSWTQKHYLHLVRAHPLVAADCLSGSITFDAENKRLVKTYARGLNLEAPKEYLELFESN